MGKKPTKSVPKMHKISEEMKQWASLIATEISGWPGVTIKSMFGMTTFYRNKTIFGAVPSTRSLGSQNTVIFKFSNPQAQLKTRLAADPRVQTGNPGQKWYSFEMSSPEDLREALTWFSESYEITRPARSKSRVPHKSKRNAN
jgi:hypothetical protein